MWRGEQDTAPSALSAHGQGSADGAPDVVTQRCLMLLSVAYPTEFSLKPGLGPPGGNMTRSSQLSSPLTPFATAGARGHVSSSEKLRYDPWSSPVPVRACFAARVADDRCSADSGSDAASLLRSRLGADSSAEQVTPSSTRDKTLSSPDTAAYMSSPVVPGNGAHEPPQDRRAIDAGHRSLPNAGDLHMGTGSPLSPSALGIAVQQDLGIDVQQVLDVATPQDHMHTPHTHTPQDLEQQAVETAAERDAEEEDRRRAASDRGPNVSADKPPRPRSASRARTGTGDGAGAAGVGVMDAGGEHAGTANGHADRGQWRSKKLGADADAVLASGRSPRHSPRQESVAVNGKGHTPHATSPHLPAQAVRNMAAADVEMAYKQEEEEEETGAAACTSPELLLFLPAFCAVIGMASSVTGVVLVALAKNQNPAASAALRTGEGSASSRLIVVRACACPVAATGLLHSRHVGSRIYIYVIRGTGSVGHGAQGQ